MWFVMYFLNTFQNIPHFDFFNESHPEAKGTEIISASAFICWKFFISVGPPGEISWRKQQIKSRSEL